MAKTKQDAQPEQVLMAELTVKQTFDEATGHYLTSYVWEGPDNGVIAIADTRVVEFLKNVPVEVEFVGHNEFAQVSYYARK